MKQTIRSTQSKAAVAYLRTASFALSDSGNSSLDQQKRLCEARARQLGVPIAATYVDDGVSGLSGSRPGLDRLLGDLSDGHIAYVITADPARLARSLALASTLTRKIARLGAKLIIAKQ